MKKPEELAAEKCAERLYEMPQQFAKSLEYCVKKQMKSCYLAGYKAAQEHAHAALEEAETRHEAYVAATQENFKRLEAKLDQTIGRWISADVQLPERDGWALILSRDETIRVRFIYLSDGCSLSDNGWDELEVIRWMPLPETIMD
jgi:hypothetical protein